jgi:hypothetical protein
VRPDLDKLVRAVLDALTGPVLADDGQVVLLSAGKFYPGDSFHMAGMTRRGAQPWPGVAVDAWQIGED